MKGICHRLGSRKFSHLRERSGGYVTAELAVSIGAVVIVLLAMMGIIGTFVAQLRCIDAAYAGARLAARGDSGAESAALRAVPGATVQIARSGSSVTVTVTRHVRAFGPLVSARRVQGRAVADLEPGE